MITTLNEHKEIPVYTHDSSLNIYQNELMNFLMFLKEVHPAFLLDKNIDERISLMAMDICNHLSDKSQWNLSKFQVWLNRLLTELQDAHSYVPLESSTLYPFIIRFWEGEFYIHSTIPSHKDILGKVITHIDNQEISIIHKQLSQWTPSENPIKSGISGSYFLNIPSFLEAIGIDTSKGMLPMTFKDGSQVAFFLEEKPQEMITFSSVSHQITGPKNIPFHYQIINDICYFQINAMIDRLSYQIGCRLMDKKAEENILASLPSFEEFLKAMYAEINENQIQTLVIDMRYNGGGNSLLSDMLLETLLPDNITFKPYQSFVRISDYLKETYPYYATIETGNNQLTNTDTLPDIKEWEIRKKLKQLFKGEVIFIQGQNTFSSANYLLTTIKDNGLFPVIGSNTSQKPTCFGDVIPILLPFTRTKAYISHSYFKRPCSDLDNEKTLYPDIFIPNPIEEKLEGKDACWDWIIKGEQNIP